MRCSPHTLRPEPRKRPCMYSNRAHAAGKDTLRGAPLRRRQRAVCLGAGHLFEAFRQPPSREGRAAIEDGRTGREAKQRLGRGGRRHYAGPHSNGNIFGPQHPSLAEYHCYLAWVECRRSGGVDVDKCKAHLLRALETKFLWTQRSFLTSEDAFASVRQDAWFQSLLDQAGDA